MKRFCPKCGVTIKNGTFCKNCIPKEYDFEVPMIQVSEYNRTWNKGKWHNFTDLEQLIKTRVQEAIKKKTDVKIEPFEFLFKKKEKEEIMCHIKIDDEIIDIPLILAYRQCDIGEKTKTNYFEGVLQLRNVKDVFYEFIQKELKKVFKKGIFVTKTSELANGGIDLYLTNKNYVKLLAQHLNVKFGAKIKINSKLFSHNHLTSKDIFRVNALAEFPKFQEGNVISFEYNSSKKRKIKEQFILVKKMGKIVTGIDILTNKTVSFESKYIDDEIIYEELKTNVVTTEPGIQVINPETYQSEEIINSLPQDIEIDDEVLVVVTKLGIVILGYPI